MTSSFTTYASGRRRELINACRVSEAWQPGDKSPEPKYSEYNAVWDTGAVLSVVSQRVADDLGLTAIDVAEVGGVTGSELTPVYLVNIGLPNGVVFSRLRVIRGRVRSSGVQTDVLIGMDIIAAGDFAVTHPGGKTKFTFRVPSQADIDFYVEDSPANTRKRMLQFAQENKARNSRSPNRLGKRKKRK